MYQVVKDAVVCTYEACDHCGALPTEDEMRAALDKAREYFVKQTCGVCGDAQILKEVELYHYKEGNQDRWAARSTILEPMFLLEDRTGLLTIQIPVHPNCVKQAMPHVSWKIRGALSAMQGKVT